MTHLDYLLVRERIADIARSAERARIAKRAPTASCCDDGVGS
jgi:hypothetical protein